MQITEHDAQLAGYSVEMLTEINDQLRILNDFIERKNKTRSQRSKAQFDISISDLKKWFVTNLIDIVGSDEQGWRRKRTEAEKRADKIENFRYDAKFIETELEVKKKTLIEDMRFLRDRLISEIAGLEERGIEANVNSCGVVQGLGTQVDIRAAEFNMLQKEYAMLKKILPYL